VAIRAVGEETGYEVGVTPHFHNNDIGVSGSFYKVNYIFYSFHFSHLAILQAPSTSITY
jgi:hypothetical protein